MGTSSTQGFQSLYCTGQAEVRHQGEGELQQAQVRKQPPAEMPARKRKAIRDALKHFKMI